MAYDLINRNVRIVDGSGRPSCNGAHQAAFRLNPCG
jgi:N-acyl-D-aspartate/D-glutamate deacylase